MSATPVEVSDSLKSVLAALRQRYGSSVAASVEARIRLSSLEESFDQATVLNLSRDPQREMPVLESLSGLGAVLHVCTVSPKYLLTPMGDDVRYSETFDSAFWDGIALEKELDVILSDGSLSGLHQVAMLKRLFPSVASGGIVVLQQEKLLGKDSASVRSVASFLRSIVLDQLSGHKQSIESSDELGYLRRNIESISFSNGSFVVQKKRFPQRRFLAVPFSTVAMDHRLLDNPDAYSRIDARIVGSEKIKSRHQSMVANLADVPAPPAEIGTLRNAYITGGGIVHTDDGLIVEESFINNHHVPRRGPFFRIGSSNQYVSERSLDAVRRVAGSSLLMKQTWDANYGHWIVDTLPRMKHYADNLDTADFKVLVNGSISSALQEMQAASLSFFDVDKEQLLPIDWQPTQAEELVYVTPSSKPPFIKSPLSIRVLESLATRVAPEIIEEFRGWEKIYLTRNSYSRRRLVNEAEILSIVQAAGYRLVVPESLTFAEQVALFSTATHVVGNMGAAFSNLAFSPPRVKVFVLATESMAHDYFYDLTCHKNGSYLALQGVAVAGASAGIGSDFVIDKTEFAKVFTEFNQ